MRTRARAIASCSVERLTNTKVKKEVTPNTDTNEPRGASAIDERANPGRREIKEDVSSLEKAVVGGSRARGVGYVSGSSRKLFKTSREKSLELST